ncbi:GNAT family N-acetyltransferase [Shewanella sp. 1_MG-2023]|uniref:GNAT family N-acetyltransferase n=1 Tax=Shewanella electrodiphila TaxID=934143 RepID=A0ABT0KK43_9GAMM|nr:MULTISPECIES: GNAT family N-acetyltransferase [Shewanella]MCL1044206.1 GNAT family N-acetyltransferase [Shewanella electrodiphila]MDO6610197.1 GNAT family N-acetyltransferase [Shewanella sp. 7_MG-2023]MDO6769661.1 GNAT family N-acetyltransferase [Shewanella sp. 2_MG-2023]MDO6792725.1 GNAT family N-acetyltransferase [Shewanella sp. 1_MG-2023]
MEQNVLAEHKAVYLTAEDLRVAASIIYNAYHDDPFFIEALATTNQASYEQKLRAAIREELTELWQQEQPLIGWFDGDRLIGVACVITHQVPLGESRYWHWRLKMVLGTGWNSTQALIKKEHSILESLPSKQYGILQFIALTPNEQSKGNGAKLIEAVLSWCDEQPDLDGIGVFVNNPKHAELFAREGFNHLSELSIGSVDGEILIYPSK